MEYTKLGHANVEVSRIMLGTMHFGPRCTQREAFGIMDRALDMGINFFDTANVYGGGETKGWTEEIIGRWLAQGGGRRQRIVLASKVYGNMDNSGWPNTPRGISAYKIRQHLEDSLRRLGTDHLDLYQVHHFDRHITVEEFWGTFERLVSQGDVLYVGTSNHPGWALAKYQMAARQRGFQGLVSEQTQYNLLNRMPELEVLPAAQDMGIGLLAYMPLAGGLLTGKRAASAGTRSGDVEAEYRLRLADEQFGQFAALCAELGESPHVVAIAWTLAHPAVASALVGVRKIEHLDGLDRAAELKLGEDVMDRLDVLFNINKGRPLMTNVAPEAYAW
jgi:aryl-alcohol dehydrogenase-like predicted oxidoreductase